MRRATTVLALMGALCGLSRAASGEMIEKTGTFAGLRVTYKVVLPDGFEPSRTYPLVLA